MRNEKFILWIFWIKEKVILRISWSKRRSFLAQEVDLSVLKNDKMTFSLAWNSMLTDHWKVLVLNFSEMDNMVFLWAKALIEKWYVFGVSEFSMIFQDLWNMILRAVSFKIPQFQLVGSSAFQSMESQCITIFLLWCLLHVTTQGYW